MLSSAFAFLLLFSFWASLLLRCSALTAFVLLLLLLLPLLLLLLKQSKYLLSTTQKEIPFEIAFEALFEGGPLVANGGGGLRPPNPPALLSREEMNKHVFSNTQEGENQTKKLQGVKSEENKYS